MEIFYIRKANAIGTTGTEKTIATKLLKKKLFDLQRTE